MSPSPLRKTMNFSQAIQNIILGGRVSKLEWDNPNVFIFLYNGFLSIKKKDGSISRLLVSEGDMIGNDWVIVTGEVKD